MSNLWTQLELWQDLVHKHGSNIGTDQLRIMLIEILPNEIQTQLWQRPELLVGTPDSIIAWLKHILTFKRSEALAAHVSKNDAVNVFVAPAGQRRTSSTRTRHLMSPA